MTKDQIRAALDALDRLEGALILSCDDIMEIHYENDAETIRAVLQSALDAGDDMVLVPREATPGILEALKKKTHPHVIDQVFLVAAIKESHANLYKAMIAAAEGDK